MPKWENLLHEKLYFPLQDDRALNEAVDEEVSRQHYWWVFSQLDDHHHYYLILMMVMNVYDE